MIFSGVRVALEYGFEIIARIGLRAERAGSILLPGKQANQISTVIQTKKETP